MLASFAGILSFVVVLAGVLCLYEYTLYDADEKAAAPVRSRVYLGTILLLILVGVGGLVAVVADVAVQTTVLGIIGIAAGLPALAQYLFHQRLDTETGPLVSRATERWL